MLLTKVSKYISSSKIYKLSKKKINFKFIHSNSKNISPGSILAISKKNKFSKKYTKEAVSKGAVAILTNKYIKEINITQYIVNNVEKNLYKLLSVLRPYPPLNSIAITGTNGKTSVVWYIAQICLYSRVDCKTYGTLGYYINSIKKNNSSLTTPDFEVLYQSAFSSKKNTYNFIFEASSHSLDQNRIKKFPINVAAITNITKDHLDYHKNFNMYKNSKYKLFYDYLDKNGYAILNDNLKDINTIKKKLQDKKIISYGKKNSNVNLFNKRNKIYLKFFHKEYLTKLSKLSNFEIENISCAIACCHCLNINIDKIINSLSKIINPPGRLEKVEKNHKVYVDYAHTPDALKKILISMTLDNKKPNLLFGCGGNRDKTKRLEMGKIANKYANKVYITDDNPRNENPSKIRKTIISKCKKGIEISNRKKAIEIAIREHKKEETLIIAGKGHEKIQILKNSIKKFDDLKIAKNELKKIND